MGKRGLTPAHRDRQSLEAFDGLNGQGQVELVCRIVVGIPVTVRRRFGGRREDREAYDPHYDPALDRSGCLPGEPMVLRGNSGCLPRPPAPR